MKADVFLYGRTEKHDYYDMYLPEWLTSASEEYREYRKTVSFIMKIRDVLPENRIDILRKTAGSFMFLKGRRISLLCRFCHICGTDEFGRPVFSTEGYIVPASETDALKKLIPDIIAEMSSDDKTFYDRYMSENQDDSKLQSISLSTEITPGGYPYPDSPQFEKLKSALEKSSSAFSFAYGSFEKKLYDYSDRDDNIKINAFFVKDECTEFAEETEEKYADFGNLLTFAEFIRTPQGRVKYKVVLCRDDSTKNRGSIAYESYERESGAEIKLSELYMMYESVKDYLLRNGTDEEMLHRTVPYSSDTTAEYTGKNIILEYRPPAQHKRSLIQVLKGEKLPFFAEYIFIKSENGDVKLSEITDIITFSDDSAAALVSYDRIMEETL